MGFIVAPGDLSMLRLGVVAPDDPCQSTPGYNGTRWPMYTHRSLEASGGRCVSTSGLVAPGDHHGVYVMASGDPFGHRLCGIKTRTAGNLFPNVMHGRATLWKSGKGLNGLARC